MNKLLELDTSRKVALLNDAFRTTFLGGTVCVTAGLHLLGDEFVKAALLARLLLNATLPALDSAARAINRAAGASTAVADDIVLVDRSAAHQNERRLTPATAT